MALTQVSSAGIKNAEVKTEDILDANITTAKIAADAVTGAKIADNAVGAEHIEVLDANLQFGDSVKVQFGTGNDLEIYHNGFNSFLVDRGTGPLYVRGNAAVRIEKYVDDSNGEAMVIANADGAVQLYFDNSQKLTTSSTGIEVSGNVHVNDNDKFQCGDLADLKIYHDGTNNIFYSDAPDLYIKTTSSETCARFGRNGGVDLYYDNAKKFETDTNGVTITGQCAVTSHVAWSDHSSGYVGKAVFGNGDDLQIYHDGSSSFVKNTTGRLDVSSTSYLYLESDNRVYIGNVGMSEIGAIFIKDGASSLWYDNSVKLETTSGGVSVSGTITGAGHFYPSANNSYSLGSSSYQFYQLHLGSHAYLDDNAKLICGNSDDLQIFHDGSHSYVKDNGTGNLKLIGGNVHLMNTAADEYMLTATADGDVKLFYDGATKFETHATGGNFYPSSDATSVRVYGSNDSTVACTLGSTNGDEGFFRAYDGGTMKTWVEARGIAFGGDTANANFLDDYEEGTWTPDFYYHSSVSGVAGHYTKIGRMVYAFFNGTIYSASSSHQRINNLPFTTADLTGEPGAVAKGWQNFDIQDGPIYYVEKNSTKVHFYKDSGDVMPASDLNGKSIRGVVIYIAA